MSSVVVNSEPTDGDTPLGRLSPEARSAWAKHHRETDTWLPLWRHAADTHAVAGMLWERWVPHSIRRAVAEALPGGADDAERLVRFLAAVHDAGKASPAFACQVEQLGDKMRQAGLDMPTAKQFGESRRLAPHGLAGQMLIQEWMRERFGFAPRVAGQFAVVAGGHHGTPPDTQQIHDLQFRPHLLRHPGPSEEIWQRVQYELMDGCAELADVQERLPAWVDVRLSQPVQVLLTAVVILSDWIASAPELFPYAPESWHPLGPAGERRRLRAAWEGLDLPAPWAPEAPVGTPEELFAGRFPHLAGKAAIRPVQAEAARVAREMEPGGLLIIEAPMGEGKTESAFIAAEILAARSGAGGVLFALPTRATGDAMFPRLLDWLEHVPDEGSGRRSVALAHAKAVLNEEWAGLLRAGSRSLAAVDPEGEATVLTDAADTPRHRPAELHAHQWLRGRKKQLLASFAVGTIDQVLFAGLKSRHLALRHLAVAGKVVVIDEVHAYDAYMSRYLDRVLEWLAAYRVPVVLLSATLPAKRRRSLAMAYAGAAGEGVEVAPGTYPLITAVAPDRPVLTAQPPAASGRRTQVALERLDDDLTALADRLDDELSGGGCALVVRNTVDRVLEAAEVLRARLGDADVTVAHSRFVAADRASKDAELLKLFGPEGESRPKRHVVVASQVVEQSLDVDFDLLVTDLAPVDLMLQRMGRLHRHSRQRPRKLAGARCLVTGVDWQAAPPEPVSGSKAVYPGDWTLLRALAVLDPHLNGHPMELPTDISPLVQQAYQEEATGPEPWAEALAVAARQHRALLAEKRRKAEGFLLGPVRRPGRPVYGWLAAHAGDADDTKAGRAQVRDSEETIEVLVVQRQDDGRLTTLPWLTRGRGGLDLPTDVAPSRRAAEAVAASALTLPGRFSAPWRIDRTIAELERTLIPAWQVKECPWLAGELLLVLDRDCQTRLSEFDLTYSPAEGLRVASPGASGGRSGNGGRREDHHNGHAMEGTEVTGPGQGGSPEDQAMSTAAVAAGKQGTAARSGQDADVGPPSFDLVREPWLPVIREDGTVQEVCLVDLFAEAEHLRRLVGDVPTQEAALLRLLLAILYDALQGPAEIEDWEELWLAEDPFAKVAGYLDSHRDRFQLFHPDRPFFQVPGLRTGKDELAPLSRIVADVPAGSAFFSMRLPGVERLSYAEAARWLVHAHAFDTSGIKSALEGDERGKGGKVYPLGVGSMGSLGGIFAEGANLRETLLLNLIAFEDAYDGAEFGDGHEDLPVWRQEHPLPAGTRDEAAGGSEPTGLRDLYTWQSRRVRLHAADGWVTGVVLGYGDPLAMSVPWKLEPMSGWRRSPTQEKKQGRNPVYLPARHDPSRAAWRGLAALLPARGQRGETGARGEAPDRLRSGVTAWLTQVFTTSEVVEPGRLVRLRLIGAVYGTQQSVIDEIVDDSVVLPIVTLHEENPIYGAAAVDAVSEAESAVSALGQLAANLARAAGSDPLGPTSTARDMGFGTLDGPYRAWLRELLQFPDLESARQAWRTTARRRVIRLGEQLLASAAPAAAEGRVVELPGTGKRLVDASRAEQWFRARLNKALTTPTK